MSTLLAAPLQPCRIEIVEKGCSWPVPLVELKTLHQVRFVSDNAGAIAFDLPELMGVSTWFEVIGHGYEVPKDGFGYRGVRLVPEPGKTLRVEVQRVNIARRLGRLTGAGLFGESLKLGDRIGLPETGVLGSDSVQKAVYKNSLFWAWGDTTLPHYPLGIFHMSGATTPAKPLERFEPPLGIAFDYFRDTNGRPRSIADISGSGPTWLSAFTTLQDGHGKEHLVATYSKIKPPLETYEVGLCVWDDTKKQFERLRTLWRADSGKPRPPFPDGHPAFDSDAEGRRWIYFGNPLPTLRCRAQYEAWQEPSSWELLKPQPDLQSAVDGSTVQPHTGHIAWNVFRRRWVAVFMQKFGKPSAFGEIWYAESPAPGGPWGKVVKVLTHENYTFYNPRLHPELTPADSPILLFEGTFTREFADRPASSPRYDYNQVLYRLDLNDPALAPAQAQK